MLPTWQANKMLANSAENVGFFPKPAYEILLPDSKGINLFSSLLWDFEQK